MRCLAHWGVDDDELWWQGKVSAVHNTEKETLLDIMYDDGDVEYRKPLERVRRVPVQKSMDSKREAGAPIRVHGTQHRCIAPPLSSMFFS